MNREQIARQVVAGQGAEMADMRLQFALDMAEKLAEKDERIAELEARIAELTEAGQ